MSSEHPLDGYELVIGLEVHAQLMTATKIFCTCPASSGNEPNTSTCPRCLGLPGTLPVLERAAVELALKAALALQCTVHRTSQFARKSYFYPDLPKGYQITQHDRPLATGGRLRIPLAEGAAEERWVAIRRLHLEEDAGKSMHLPAGSGTAGAAGEAGSLVDFNRCGVPLIEIVSEPALRSPEEASSYLKELRSLLRYLGVCDGNMEEGSFRCDANLSLRRRGEQVLGTRTELKNLNSFRYIRAALHAEALRQAALLSRGQPIAQETRLFDPASGHTLGMRGKEESHDYRYFPEPDLPELVVDEPWLAALSAALPELPHQRRQRYREELGLPPADAAVLTVERGIADYFEAVLAAGAPAKPAANWLMTELLRRWDGVSGPPPVPPARLAELLALLGSGELTGTLAKRVWELMVERGGSPREIIAAEGLVPAAESELAPVVERVLAEHPAQVASYRAGKKTLLGFFVGQAMRATAGKGDAARLKELLAARLEREDG